MAEIDWATTGQMLSGIGSIAGAVAVAYAARTGAATFDSWRRQKKEDKRIEAASELMHTVNKAVRSISFVRSPDFHQNEIDENMFHLRDSHKFFENLSIEQRQRISKGGIILERYTKNIDVWDSIEKITPVARTVFGTGVEESLNKLNDLIDRLDISITQYCKIFIDPERVLFIEEDILEGSFEADEFGRSVRKCRDELAGLMNPIIRH